MLSPTNLIAEHYCVSHILSATTPCSRLSDILARMYQGQPLTRYSRDYLQQQNLLGLYRLACGDIDHTTYVAELDPNDMSRHEAAKLVNQAKEDERKARANHYLAVKANHPVKAREADRKVRHASEREETEAVLKAQQIRQAEFKVQRERNGELAAAIHQSRLSAPDYIEPTTQDIARHFHLEHIAAAVSPPLSDYLDALFRGRALTAEALTYLRNNGPADLYRLAFGQLARDAYIAAAKVTEAEALARKSRVDAAEAARIARENDPEYIAMMQTQALYGKYAVLLTDKTLMPRMSKLLQKIDAGNRLPKEDLEWLGTSARGHFTAPLRKAYHQLEADFHADQYRKIHDTWSAVNACGHYRKCDQSARALELIDSILEDRLKPPKVRSAVLTTRGGALRDLRRLPEAILAGERAHALMPTDYRPCTLLGAVHMELRDFEEGHDWYEKARQRGATEHAIDAELRSIFQQLDSPGREAMKRFLLAEDPRRYQWLNEMKSRESRPRSGSEDRKLGATPSRSATPTSSAKRSVKGKA